MRTQLTHAGAIENISIWIKLRNCRNTKQGWKNNQQWNGRRFQQAHDDWPRMRWVSNRGTGRKDWGEVWEPVLVSRRSVCYKEAKNEDRRVNQSISRVCRLVSWRPLDQGRICIIDSSRQNGQRLHRTCTCDHRETPAWHVDLTRPQSLLCCRLLN